LDRFGKSFAKAPELPPVFIDRSLGKDIVRRLQDVGVAEVHHMADHFQDDGQHTEDEEWIRLCGAMDWIAFSKDDNLRRHHKRTLRLHRVIVFAIPDAGMSGAAQAARYVENLHAIARRARKGGPVIHMIYAHGIKRVWP